MRISPIRRFARLYMYIPTVGRIGSRVDTSGKRLEVIEIAMG